MPTARGMMPNAATVQISRSAWMARNQSESSDVPMAPLTSRIPARRGTRRLVQFRLHRNVDPAGNGREPLFAAQLAHPVIVYSAPRELPSPESRSQIAELFLPTATYFLLKRFPYKTRSTGVKREKSTPWRRID